MFQLWDQENVQNKGEKELAKLHIEALIKIITLSSRIDTIIKALGIEPEKIGTREVELKESIEETLGQIEFELYEIEKTIDTLGLTDPHTFVSRIKTML